MPAVACRCAAAAALVARKGDWQRGARRGGGAVAHLLGAAAGVAAKRHGHALPLRDSVNHGGWDVAHPTHQGVHRLPVAALPRHHSGREAKVVRNGTHRHAVVHIHRVRRAPKGGQPRPLRRDVQRPGCHATRVAVLHAHHVQRGRNSAVGANHHRRQQGGEVKVCNRVRVHHVQGLQHGEDAPRAPPCRC